MRALSWVAIALGLSACGNDERVALGGAPDAASGDAEPPDAAPPVDAGPRIRSVERRNPFGNTATENNLMVDGDFEWTSGSGQHGWRAMTNQGEAELVRETGGLCHSGVTCGVLEQGIALIGLAVAPRGKKMLITLYAKPPASDPDCYSTSVSVISCTAAAVFNLASVPPTRSVPDQSGWCQYRALGPVLDEQPCLYVTGFAAAGDRILIDNVSIIAADGTGASPLAAAPPSPEMWARVQRDVRWLHEHQLFGRSPATRP